MQCNWLKFSNILYKDGIKDLKSLSIIKRLINRFNEIYPYEISIFLIGYLNKRYTPNYYSNRILIAFSFNTSRMKSFLDIHNFKHDLKSFTKELDNCYDYILDEFYFHIGNKIFYITNHKDIDFLIACQSLNTKAKRILIQLRYYMYKMQKLNF